jgi:hypothetical protein
VSDTHGKYDEDRVEPDATFEEEVGAFPTLDEEEAESIRPAVIEGAGLIGLMKLEDDESLLGGRAHRRIEALINAKAILSKSSTVSGGFLAALTGAQDEITGPPMDNKRDFATQLVNLADYIIGEEAGIDPDEEDEPKVSYPYPDGDTLVIGPEAFVSHDESVLNWRGVNYARTFGQPIPDEAL